MSNNENERNGKVSNLKKNLFLNVGYQIFTVIIPLVLAPYVSRTIGAEGAGIYSYNSSVAACFALIGMLGISNYGNRTIAKIGDDKEKRSETFWNIWTVQIIMSVCACFLYLIYCGFAVKDNQIIAYVNLITVLCSFFDINWFFWGIEKFQVTILRNTVVKILNMASIFLFVKDHSDLLLYTVIMVCGALLNCLFLFPFLTKEIVFVKPRLSEIKYHLKPIVILFFPVLAISVYKIMDKVMLGVLSTAEQTGYYEYAEKIISLPVTFITAVGSVMLPRLSVIVGKKDMMQAKRFIRITMEVIMCFTIAMQAGIFSVAKDFAPLFFGEDFTASGAVLMVLSFSVIFQGWANVIRTQYLIPMGEDSVYVRSTCIGAIVNLISNLLLIPFLDAVGAAIGTVLAEFAVAFYQSFKVRKNLPVLYYLKSVLFYSVPALGMFGVIKIIDAYCTLSPLGCLIVEVIIGAMLYFTFSALCLKKRYVNFLKNT